MKERTSLTISCLEGLVEQNRLADAEAYWERLKAFVPESVKRTVENEMWKKKLITLWAEVLEEEKEREVKFIKCLKEAAKIYEINSKNKE
jgi:peroxiredoxin family protein